jgi:hypothetical protein
MLMEQFDFGIREVKGKGLQGGVEVWDRNVGGWDGSSAMWDLSMTAGRAMTRPPENRSVAIILQDF